MTTDPTVAGPQLATPPPPPRRPIPGRRCARCGYSLARLPIDGVCPECATPIADTLRGELHAATPKARARVRLGLLILLIATPLLYFVAPAALLAGSSITTYVVTPLRAVGPAQATSTYAASDVSTQATNAARAIALSALVAMIVGHLLLTTPLFTGYRRLTWRRIARLSLLPTLPLAGVFFVAIDPFARALAALALAPLWITHHLAVALHAHTLALQIPAPAVARHATVAISLAPALLVLSAFAAMMVGQSELGFPLPLLPFVTPLIALALYWTFLYRLERHLAQLIAERRSPPR